MVNLSWSTPTSRSAFIGRLGWLFIEQYNINTAAQRGHGGAAEAIILITIEELLLAFKKRLLLPHYFVPSTIVELLSAAAASRELNMIYYSFELIGSLWVKLEMDSHPICFA